MNDDEFEDVCAMLAMLGWIINGDYHEEEIPYKAQRIARRMVLARAEPDIPDHEEGGIVAIKKRKYVRKA
jgi:hypothetical protein